MTLWLFEEGSFVPAAMVRGGRTYSLVTDQLGTPTEAYDADGNRVWGRVLDMDGRVIEETGNVGMVPFLFQGQYYDRETGLAYNRFRYYDPSTGAYISQDPIGLAGGILNLYGYVDDTNCWIDILGLSKQSYSQKKGINKAKEDLRRNGFDIVGEEITMKVNGSRIRVDIIAKDQHGKNHIFEVKHKTGRLTKNQKKIRSLLYVLPIEYDNSSRWWCY